MSQNTQQQVSPQDVRAPANQATTQLTTPTTSSVGLDSLRSSYAAQQEAQIQTFLQSHGFESSTRIYQNSLTGSHVYRSTRNGADVVIKVSVPTVFQDAFGSVKFSEDYAKGEETSLRKVAESSQRLYPGERLFPALQGRISDGNELHGVVLEYIPGKNGQEYLESLKIEDRQMSTDQLVTFLRSGLAGVHCLQDAGLRHRDLNPRNIIIDETGEVKIIDLNFSKQLNQTAFTTIEPEGFYPPDAYGPQASGLSVDSYAIGMMALSLFTQQRPFDLVSAKGEVQLHDAKLDPALKNFLKKLCATNPKDRFADPQSAIRELDKIAKKLARAGRVDKSSATEGVVAKVAEPQRQVSAVDVSTGAAPSVPVGLRLLALSNVKFLQEQALKSVLGNEGDMLGALELLAGSRHTSIRYRILEIASRYGDQATPVYVKLAGSDNEVLQLKVLEAVEPYDQVILPVLERLAESKHDSVLRRVFDIARRYEDKALPVYAKLANSGNKTLQLKVLGAVEPYDQARLPVLEQLAESKHPAVLIATGELALRHGAKSEEILARVFQGYDRLFAAVYKRFFVVGKMSVNGEQLDTLLSERDWDDPQPTMLGYRVATRDENMAYALSLLLKAADRSINKSELEALSIYREIGVRHEDDRRNSGIRVIGNSAKDHEVSPRSQTGLASTISFRGALFVRASNYKVRRGVFGSEAECRLKETRRESKKKSDWLLAVQIERDTPRGRRF